MIANLATEEVPGCVSPRATATAANTTSTLIGTHTNGRQLERVRPHRITPTHGAMLPLRDTSRKVCIVALPFTCTGPRGSHTYASRISS
jgi:hypothetical protein